MPRRPICFQGAHDQAIASTMNITATAIPDVKIITPKVFGDSRGYFLETHNQAAMKAAGIDANFCQDNESCSGKGVLRGLHFQRPPYEQAKLVRVVRGSVWDVAVDLRKESPTFGNHVAVVLSGENKQQLFIPRGFAHGFLVLEDETIFSYKCDNFYAPQAEAGIRWDDPQLNIAWPKSDVPFLLSQRDRSFLTLNESALFSG